MIFSNLHSLSSMCQLHVKEDALVTFKSELAVMELEVQVCLKNNSVQ